MRHIRAICFDLDDTLWDMGPVIPRAEQRLYTWFGEHYPRVVEHYSVEKLHRLRREVGERHPELIHDLSSLRLKKAAGILAEADLEQINQWLTYIRTAKETE